MKVKKEHFDLLKQYLQLAIDEKGRKTFEDHWNALPAANPKPKDCGRRFRWDCLWAAQNMHREKTGDGFPLTQWNYKDEHVDTALRALMVALNLPQ